MILKPKAISLCLLCLFCYFSSPLVSSAQSKESQVKKGKHAKELVEEMRSREKKLTHEAINHLDKKRRETIKRLQSIIKRYQRKNDHATAGLLAKEIKKIERRLGKMGTVSPDKQQKNDTSRDSDSTVALVHLNMDYHFKNESISGKLKFKANQLVEATYKLDNRPQHHTWKYEIFTDHLVIHADRSIGDIMLSEIPGRKKYSVMLRWGSKLKHAISTATTR